MRKIFLCIALTSLLGGCFGQLNTDPSLELSYTSFDATTGRIKGSSISTNDQIRFYLTTKLASGAKGDADEKTVYAYDVDLDGFNNLVLKKCYLPIGVGFYLLKNGEYTTLKGKPSGFDMSQLACESGDEHDFKILSGEGGSCRPEDASKGFTIRCTASAANKLRARVTTQIADLENGLEDVLRLRDGGFAEVDYQVEAAPIPTPSEGNTATIVDNHDVTEQIERQPFTVSFTAREWSSSLNVNPQDGGVDTAGNRIPNFSVTGPSDGNADAATITFVAEKPARCTAQTPCTYAWEKVANGVTSNNFQPSGHSEGPHVFTARNFSSGSQYWIKLKVTDAQGESAVRQALLHVFPAPAPEPEPLPTGEFHRLTFEVQLTGGFPEESGSDSGIQNQFSITCRIPGQSAMGIQTTCRPHSAAVNYHICTLECQDGAEISLIAQPEHHWKLTRWAGDCHGTALETTVHMDGDKTCRTEMQIKPQHPLTFVVSTDIPNQVGGVGVIRNAENEVEQYCSYSSTPCLRSVFEDDVFHFATRIQPMGHNDFSHFHRYQRQDGRWDVAIIGRWEGDCVGDGLIPPIYGTFTMPTRDARCEAVFVPRPRKTLFIELRGEGEVYAHARDNPESQPIGAVCTTAPRGRRNEVCNIIYYVDASFILDVSPAAGYRFSRWEGDCSGSADRSTFTMLNRDMTCRAVFEENE
ncbi:MAG: hypothetical protein HY540_05145 [Deltaproteobacteria bacterium]|nr:hypothetical protein [Deltaproteobacteria bacterium]